MMATLFGLADLFLFGIVWFSIWSLRKTHASEIYVTWLFFSFFFVLFLLLDAAVVKDVFGNSGAAIFEALRGYLMDFNAEVKMVLSIFALLVFPQLLTYFLSGISGSASPPVFVS